MLVAPASGFRSRLERIFDALAPDAPRSDALLEQLEVWLDLTVRWNRRIDLTAARDADALADLLVADAVAIWNAGGMTRGERWLDVGSGVGAPGLALALLSPEISMTLIEPRQKRAAFLRTVLGALERSDVVVERRRSDALPAKYAEVAVSRATLPPEQWLAEGLRLATAGTWVLLAGGPAPVREDCVVVRDLTYRWPLGGAVRRAVRFAPVPR